MQAYELCASQPQSHGSVFGECQVFQRLAGPPLSLVASLHLTSAARLALLALADNPRLEILSGHQADGRPSEREHLAIVPLANIGYEHSDGDIKGLGVVLPARVGREERREVLIALSRLQELQLGACGVWQVGHVLAAPIWSLNWSRYVGPSATWATVTPMVFARHPRKSRPVEAMVAEACRQVGWPDPVTVEVGPHPPFTGVPSARDCGTVSTSGKPILPPARRGQRMPSVDSHGNPARFRSHVRIAFAEPVAGPVILGAGQYLGMGLLAPCGHDRKFVHQPEA